MKYFLALLLRPYRRLQLLRTDAYTVDPLTG